MSEITTFLREQNILPSISAANQAEAVETLANTLRWDERICDFDAFVLAIAERNTAPIIEGDCAILIAHGRTNAVQSLVLAAGILPAEGLVIEGEGISAPLRLIFLAGIPAAFSAEYLRIVGIIARTCRNATSRMALLDTKTPETFLSILAAAERRSS